MKAAINGVVNITFIEPSELICFRRRNDVIYQVTNVDDFYSHTLGSEWKWATCALDLTKRLVAIPGESQFGGSEA